MPTYQYACTECGHAFEQVQSFSDPSLTICPECGGRLRKVFSATGVVFKGSGFYRTDSRSESRAGQRSSSTGESGGSGTTTSSPGSSTPSTSTTPSGASSSGAASSPASSD